MKTAIFFLIFLPSLFSCTGDCFSCHPQLLENIDETNHKPMLLCKNCHLDTGSTSQCGADCFECHREESISRDILEHRAIDDCRECHLKKIISDDKLFTPFEKSDLRNFLKF